MVSRCNIGIISKPHSSLIGWHVRSCVQVMDFLGSAAFSKAVQALDTKTGMLVCLKIIKVSMRLVSMNSHVVAMSMSCSHQAPLFIHF